MLISVDENDKRYRIMKAAAKIFAHKGFHRAKIEEIAQEAGVGKGTVYEYFPSKQQLFMQMFKVGKDYYLDVLTKQINQESGLYDKLKNITYLHLKFFIDHTDIARVMMQEFLQLGAEMHKAVFQTQEQEIGLLDELFQQGIEEGCFRSIDTKLTAYAFYGSVHAIGVSMIFYGERPNLEKLSREIVDVFLQGIKK
ncbi:MAG: TetR/AcrR family transcriptional regulator [Bacillota bacterium]